MVEKDEVVAEMNDMEFTFSRDLLNELEGSTPGLVVQAYSAGKKEIDFKWGETYSYYDLASVTKVVFTVSAMMKLYEQGKYKLEDSVRKHLSWFSSETVTVQQLLAHYSGFVWWLPVYEQIRKLNYIGIENREHSWNYLREVLLTQHIPEANTSTYSDLDFWTLGFLIEELWQKDLVEVWNELKEDFGLKKTHFHSGNRPVYAKEEYAPTEECPWRGKVQGGVHDDNAWSISGVAAHAGLFSTADELSHWALCLRKILLEDQGYVSKETLKKFIQQHGPGEWAMGMMMPSPEKSLAGTKMSRSAVGHWGFTGTGIWWDHEKDIIITTLSNRTYPNRDNTKFAKQLRPRIHDEIYQWLEF